MSNTTSLSPARALDPDVGLRPVLEQALRIRNFENALQDLFKRGLLFGTVHTCVGQELCAAALHPHLRPGEDAFFATHRGHGHYLAYGGSEEALLAELMGREGALCLGRGGTQNLFWQRFFSAGIQGGSAPIGVGFAWAMKRRKEDSIAVVQVGDGTLGEGTLYEAFTFAALLKAPVLFLLECNGWAQSTDVRTTTPGDVAARIRGFGLDVETTSDDDPAALHDVLGRVVANVRQGRPSVAMIRTRRLLAHSKGDDNRPKDLIEKLWQEDPLSRLLTARPGLQSAQAASATEINATAEAVARRPKVGDPGKSALPSSVRTLSSLELHADASKDRGLGRIAEELNRGLHEAMTANPEVIVLGEDLLDPYGGAFKVTRGLSTKFADRVFSTPIAEAGIAGVSNGLALAGFRPVAEIMFADFVTLASDQLINFAAKFNYMYAGKVTCPTTIRLVSGGGRGYGPTHSQSTERLFCGVPGLQVVALSHRHDCCRLIQEVVLRNERPTVFVENKLLYSERPPTEPPLDCRIQAVEANDGSFPALHYVSASRNADVTVVTYGGSAPVCERAMKRLFETDELAFDYIILTQLWPLDLAPILASARRTRRLLVVEENVAAFGISAAVISGVAQAEPGIRCRAVGAQPLPIPSVRHLEDLVLPGEDAVIAGVRNLF
ncbi:MAG TPA: thiamine pyrophosphate-dependent enzyme [Candidatus Didemnitutus sp.]|nr:thiamine pyrophosphate-dependent enzyme [Candidatus Didemnitutus sp.]